MRKGADRVQIGTRKKPHRGRERPHFCRYITGQNPSRIPGVTPVHDCGCAYLFLAGTSASRAASSCASTSAGKPDGRSDAHIIIARPIPFPRSQIVALARGRLKARRWNLRPLRGATNAALTHPPARVRFASPTIAGMSHRVRHTNHGESKPTTALRLAGTIHVQSTSIPKDARIARSECSLHFMSRRMPLLTRYSQL